MNAPHLPLFKTFSNFSVGTTTKNTTPISLAELKTHSLALQTLEHGVMLCWSKSVYGSTHWIKMWRVTQITELNKTLRENRLNMNEWASK